MKVSSLEGCHNSFRSCSQSGPMEEKLLVGFLAHDSVQNLT